MSDFYLVVCQQHQVYADLEKWNPTTKPMNKYRYMMQHRLRCFNKEHQHCKIVTYSLSGYSSDGSPFPDVDKLKEVCKFERIQL